MKITEKIDNVPKNKNLIMQITDIGNTQIFYVLRDNNVKEQTNLRKIVLYKVVFGNDVWCEGYIHCGKKYPLKYQFKYDENFNDKELKPFYRYEELKRKFENLPKSKKNYIEITARTEEKSCVGFIWGWEEDNLKNLNDETLKLGEEDINILESGILKQYPDFKKSNFYYLADIGVDEKLRKKNIARNLYNNMLNTLKNGEKQYQYIIARTTTNAEYPHKWFTDMGFKDVYYYKNDEDNRVIMIAKIPDNV